MARKGENIFKRKDGRWEARYVRGREPSGRIIYGFCYGKTYLEAKEKAARCKAALLAGAPVPGAGGRHRFGYFCEEWLRQTRDKVKESTYIKYDTILKRHILPGLGSCPPQAVTTQLVVRFREALLAEGLSPKTVRDILAVLHGILRYTAAQCPGAFPAVEVAYPRDPRKAVRVLDREEQARLVAYLKAGMDSCNFGILLALLTGLRLGELCALRWKSISLRDRTLRVDATMQRLRDCTGTGGRKTRVVTGSPKSGTSIRTIPLSESAVSLCRQFDPCCPAAFVLTGTEDFMEPRQVQRQFARAARACGLEGVHFHTIRHTFATRCVEAGFELKSLSEILGHADTSVTLDRYVHASMALKRENMDKLEKVGL